MLKEKQTELNILNAAREVFRESGFHGARMQAIADRAGINKSLLHYYFRSKDKLFEVTLKQDLAKLFSGFFKVFESDLSFDKKISLLITNYIELLQANPQLPGFIIHELNANPEALSEFIKGEAGSFAERILKEIQVEIDKGRIIDISPEQIIINVLSQVIFPFIAKPLFSKILNLGENAFENILEERKKILPQIILKGLAK